MARKNREEKEKQENNKKTDYHYWLRPSSPLAAAPTSNKNPTFSLFSEEDYTKWLHPDSLASLSTKTSTKTIPEFSSILTDDDYGKWLHPESLAQTSKDVDKCSSKNQTFYPVASENGFNFMNSLVPTSASNGENIWLARSSVNQTLMQHSGLSVSSVLNELKQNSGKLAHVQNNWAQWLKR